MPQFRPDFYLGTSVDGVHLSAEQLNVRSVNLNDLIGSLTWTEALFHILRGRKPTGLERQLFDIVLVAFHGGFGLLPPTTLVPRLVAGTGVSTAQALAAGFLASGPYHVGAVEQAMKLYSAIADEFRQQPDGIRTAGDLEQFAWNSAARRIDAGEVVGGFGHPLLRRDPRPTHIRRLVCELGVDSPGFDIYDGVVRCLREKKAVPPNVDGICGAILLELGFRPQHGTGLFLMARSAAMLAHIVEEQTDMPYQTMKRFMLLPVAMPKLFNADFKRLARRFNRLRDSNAYNRLRDVLTRRARREAAERERASQTVVDEHRRHRNAATIDAASLPAPQAPQPSDRFVETSSAIPGSGRAGDPPGDDRTDSALELPELLLDGCSSPELLAGAALFLSSCLRALPAGEPSDSGNAGRTQSLINAALDLVEQAARTVRVADSGAGSA